MKQIVLLSVLFSFIGCANATTLTPSSTATARLSTRTPIATQSIATRTPISTRTHTRIPSRTPSATFEPTNPPTIRPPTATQTISPASPVLVGAGDIAVCGTTGSEATARLLDNIDGTVFTLGDNLNQSSSLDEFKNCYAPTWGRHKARTHPVIGNHDNDTSNASGYYEYFGERAGEAGKGYYAYDVGAWQIVVLNSEIDTSEHSEQAEWLRTTLATRRAQCTIAMAHRPLFSSGPHGRDGDQEKMRALWNILYDYDVDLMLSGHDHDYERFAPQNPNGERDDARGIRQFVVGTGGAAPFPFGEPQPNSEKRITGPFGVLKLTLHETSYAWEFVSIAPLLFKDSGTGECH